MTVVLRTLRRGHETTTHRTTHESMNNKVRHDQPKEEKGKSKGVNKGSRRTLEEWLFDKRKFTNRVPGKILLRLTTSNLTQSVFLYNPRIGVGDEHVQWNKPLF